jgi:hypothetical protein
MRWLSLSRRIPDRCLSFQVIFTGCEADDGSQPNVHGGAMWARMPITALVGDIPLQEWPERLQTHLAQPWDCSSYNHGIVKIERAQPSPWLCKINNEFTPVGICSRLIMLRV